MAKPAVSLAVYSRLHCRERSRFYRSITRAILHSPATTTAVCDSPVPRLNPVFDLAYRPRFLHVPSPYNLTDVHRSQVRYSLAMVCLWCALHRHMIPIGASYMWPHQPRLPAYIGVLLPYCITLHFVSEISCSTLSVLHLLSRVLHLFSLLSCILTFPML